MQKTITSPKDLEHEYPQFVAAIRASASLEERQRLKAEYLAGEHGARLMQQAAEKANLARRNRA